MLTAVSTLPRAQQLLLAMLVVLLVLVQFDQPYPKVAPLHHVPTVLLILFAPWLLGRWPLSTTSLGCIILFLALHTLGGRYTYSNVPYDQWSRLLTGVTLSELFGWDRNHYDRVVHFAFGALSVAPVAQIMRQRGSGTRSQVALAVACWVLVASSLYEIFEWLFAVIAAGELADQYNGQQGDIWDVQKDMALAALGALCLLPFTRVRTG